jgi:GT2 family glycosyltransferase
MVSMKNLILPSKRLVVCIPVHGISQPLERALKSINEHVGKECLKKGIHCTLMISNSKSCQSLNVSDYWQGEYKVLPVPLDYYWGAAVKTLFAAAKKYDPTHILLMNHDVVVTSNAFTELLKAIPDNPHSVLSSISVVMGTNRIENAGFRYTNNSIPFLNLHINQPYEDVLSAPYEVDALNGRFLIFPSDAANPNYLFPHLVPHYFADTALSSVVRRAGFKLLVVPTSKVLSDQSDTEFKKARSCCNDLASLYSCLFKPYSYRYIWGSFWGQILLVDNLFLGIPSSLKYTLLRIFKSIFELLGFAKSI